ncbi:unnamed protein product [Vitrella brassicaformis CCMP3155]|uniref:Uncharacterized protein n=2 Tax=Vitrella brassicaformis TaxID=1169539 RepID=A0A0G4EAY6_VITBC|nr:unnamed protein product [Vitrella brassicaformis CCMP3155]|eukprot:CEL93079.1 unnamed protein product [Vitrella brassicaformis CCMP3155]
MAAKPIQEAASEAAQPLRPWLDQLMNPNEADEEPMEQSDEQEGGGEVPAEDGEGEGEVAAKGVYKPPKLLAVEYTGDHLSAAAKAHREADRQRERLKKTEYVRSLRQEISDVPEEVGGSDLRRDAEAAALMRRQVERQQIEEESFRRIQINKKEKRDLKRLREKGKLSRDSTGMLLSDLTSLADSTIAMAGSGASQRVRGSRGKKTGPSNKRGGALGDYLAATEKSRDVLRSTQSVPTSAGEGFLGSRKRGSKGQGGRAMGFKKRRQDVR